MELARRVTACDVSADTLDRLGTAFDELAGAYTSVPPGELIGRLRMHLADVAQLMEIARSEDEARAGRARPRRIAAARLDLDLALLAGAQPDEAAAVTTAAIVSGRVVPSNWWRATEVVRGVERYGVREAIDLREAYEAYRPR